MKTESEDGMLRDTKGCGKALDAHGDRVLPRNGKRVEFLRRLKRQKGMLAVLLIYLAYIGVFAYYPMYGVVLAFKEFSIRKGILGSPWADPWYKWFRYFFTSPDFAMVMRNTLGMSFLKILIGFPMPILFALLINEIYNRRFKRVVQSVSYLPHFISWVVITGLMHSVLSGDGIINQVLMTLGLTSEPILFLGQANLFWGLVTVLGIWKEIGWSSIIYLSSISGLDPEMYESAVLDGAGRVRQAVSITLPCLMPTIVMLFIMQLGYILSVGFEQQYFLQNPMNYKSAEVIDTYVFKMGLQNMKFSYSTAVGLFKSVTGLCLVCLTNLITRRTLKMSIF